MAMRYVGNTDHWSKMRMKMIKNTINLEQQGRVLTWEKHQKKATQQELEAGIRNQRNLPGYNPGVVHNFEDIIKVELNGYLHRPSRKQSFTKPESPKTSHQNRRPSVTTSRYTLMTLPTDPWSDQTRSRVPVLQCRGRI